MAAVEKFSGVAPGSAGCRRRSRTPTPAGPKGALYFMSLDAGGRGSDLRKLYRQAKIVGGVYTGRGPRQAISVWPLPDRGTPGRPCFPCHRGHGFGFFNPGIPIRGEITGRTWGAWRRHPRQETASCIWADMRSASVAHLSARSRPSLSGGGRGGGAGAGKRRAAAIART